MSSIYIYDSNQLGLWSLVYDESFQVNSVADMVQKVLTVTGEDSFNHQLYIGGIGGLNYQSVGACNLNDTTGDRSLQLGENGELLGSAAIWLPKLAGKFNSIFLYQVDDADGKSNKLMIKVAEIFGIGTTVYGKNTLMKFRGKLTQARRPTQDAVVDREALRKRLSVYTKSY